MEMLKTNLNANHKRLQTKEVFGELHWIDCQFGQPFGQDDYINECDCYDNPVYAKLLTSINEIWR